MNHRVSSISKTPMTAVIIAVWAGIFYVCYFLFENAFFSGETPPLVISGLVCSLSAFGVLAFLVREKIHRKKATIILILCIGADIGINMLIQDNQNAGGKSLLHYYAGINLSLMGIALCGGILMAGIIKKPSYLIPIAAAAGLADIWSVAFGVTNKIVQSPAAMNYLLLSFPVAGKGILPIIGVTDFVFAAMFLSISYRFNMPIVRTRILVTASFIISISVAVFGGFGVPVLPVMGLLFIIGHYKHVKLVDPKEKKEAMLGIFIIAAVLTALTLIKYIK